MDTQKYISKEGKFRVHGKNGRYKIYKDNRFIFYIENGQIKSVKDKLVSGKKIHYNNEVHHGNNK